MRPFQFRLERLKRVRSAQERAAKADFALAISALNAAEEARQHALERRDSARDELRHVMQEGKSAGTLMTAQRVTDRFDKAVELAQADVSTASVQAEEKRNAWIALRNEEEGLERLRATHQSEHRRETERQLSRELDEIAMSRSAAIGKHVSNMLTATDSTS
jgi:flagellar export protein FliJ